MDAIRRFMDLLETISQSPKRTGSEFENYKHSVEDVPIQWLRKLTGNNLRYDTAELVQDIQTNGMQSPLIINVGKNSRTAFLGEGNHRLAALYAAGYDYAPCRVVVGSEWGKNKLQPKGMDDDIIPQPGEYFKADAKPSEVFKSLQGQVR
jgi:hypothetical protein